MRSSIMSLAGCSCLALALLVITAGQGAAQKDKAITVTAVDLTKAYGDTTQGNKQYLGKTLIVEGKIISSTRIVGVVVALEGFKGPKEKEVRRVFCNMKPGSKPTDFKVGETVKIQGKCKGNGISRFVSVELEKCEVVK